MSREACIELAKRFGADADDVIELWLERAAVREYDGGLSRAEAEVAALEDVRADLDPLVGAEVVPITQAVADAPRRGPRAASSPDQQIELPFGKRS